MPFVPVIHKTWKWEAELLFCQSNPITFCRPRCLSSHIIIIRTIPLVQCFWTHDLLFCEQRTCNPHVPDLGVVVWENLEGGGGTFSFCLRLRQPSFRLIVNDRVVGGIRTLFSLDLSPTLLIPCTITLTPTPSLRRKEPAVRNGTKVIRSLQFTVNWFSHVHVNLWSGGRSSRFC